MSRLAVALLDWRPFSCNPLVTLAPAPTPASAPAPSQGKRGWGTRQTQSFVWSPPWSRSSVWSLATNKNPLKCTPIESDGSSKCNRHGQPNSLQVPEALWQAVVMNAEGQGQLEVRGIGIAPYSQEGTKKIACTLLKRTGCKIWFLASGGNAYMWARNWLFWMWCQGLLFCPPGFRRIKEDFKFCRKFACATLQWDWFGQAECGLEFSNDKECMVEWWIKDG